MLIRDDDAALTMLQQSARLGVRIALDDFGTGYSSLSYLQRFPFDKIKIDRSFVDGIDANADGRRDRAGGRQPRHRRDMTTTAEGVETEQQREMLRDLGCTEMQGFLFSRPLPVEQIRTLLLLRTKKTAAA